MSTSETIEEWAARTARVQTTAQWQLANIIAEGKAWDPACRDWLEWVYSTEPPSLECGLPASGKRLALALRACRDRVARRLSRSMRDLLREAIGNETAAIRRLLGGEMWVTYRALQRRGLVVECCQMPYATPFGREVDSILETRR